MKAIWYTIGTEVGRSFAQIISLTSRKSHMPPKIHVNDDGQSAQNGRNLLAPDMKNPPDAERPAQARIGQQNRAVRKAQRRVSCISKGYGKFAGYTSVFDRLVDLTSITRLEYRRASVHGHIPSPPHPEALSLLALLAIWPSGLVSCIAASNKATTF